MNIEQLAAITISQIALNAILLYFVWIADSKENETIDAIGYAIMTTDYYNSPDVVAWRKMVEDEKLANAERELKNRQLNHLFND